mgnify:CR=1 FL=1
MKILAISAVVALIGVDAKHHHHHKKHHSFIQQQVMGIDTKELQPDQHWRLPWP